MKNLLPVPTSRRLVRAPLLWALFFFCLVIWLPSLFTPLWGDDYLFLQAAKAARIQEQSWWQPFWPNSINGFWRPLSMDSYFRFIETNASNPQLAHAFNFLLWLLSCMAVGLFAKTLARICDWKNPGLIGAFAVGIYGINDVHFLPLHWISTANSSFLVLWSALTMTAWTTAPSSRGVTRILLCLSLPLLQVLALFSKESAVLNPLLLLCLTAFTFTRVKPKSPEIFAWLVCVTLCIAWYYFYQRFTTSRDEGYSLMLGSNIFRNILSLTAWLLNIPREALRMILTGSPALGILWAAAVALPLLLSAFIVMRSIIEKTSPTQILASVFFVAIAYAPYFFLASQSYEYYAAIAMILPLIMLARGVANSNRAAIAIALICLSSFIAIQGSRALGYPSLIGRAIWAEQQLTNLSQQKITVPLVVQVENQHQFYAIGSAGLSWRLGIKESDIIFSNTCSEPTTKMLVQQQDGNFYWRDCKKN